MSKLETVSVSVVSTEKGWQANVRKPGSDGFTVAIDRDPAMALFDALHRAGLTNGADWRNPNPFRRLENALDRAILAFGSL